MPNPDLDQVPNPDFKASSKSGLDTRHKSLTRSSHLQVRVKNPAQVPNPDLVEGAKNQVRVRDPAQVANPVFTPPSPG